jgi:uncharacterized protein (DUF305 family)
MNKLNPILALILAAACAASLAAAAQAQTTPPAPHSAMPMAQPASGKGAAGDMKHSMMSGMDSMQKMQMSGDTDKDFAMMMKLHHQGAIDMAEMQLAHGKSPEMKAMAKTIIAEQKKEIAAFDRWLAKQK